MKVSEIKKKMSVDYIVSQLKQIFVRFPFSILITIVGTVSSIILSTYNFDYGSSLEDVLVKVVLVSVFAFPWVTFAEIYCEKKQLKTSHRLGVQLLVTLLASSYYYFLPKSIDLLSEFEGMRLFAFTVSGIIFLIFSSYASGDQQKTWQYLASSVRAILISALFSIPLGLGLMLSVGSFDYLFETDFDLGEIFSVIWSLVLGIYATWFFLSHLLKPKQKPTYTQLSKVLLGFLTYIWVPLVSIFFIILYSYFAKIVITTDWPNGGVSNWILGFSLFGVLAYVFSYGTLTKYDELKQKFFKLFYILEIPLVIMLFVAIGLRINEYGLTENRYAVVISGIWLLLISLYHIIKKQKMLSFMAYSMLVIIFVSFIGPLNMHTTSLYSQKSKLVEVLQTNNLLVDGKAVVKEVTLPGDVYRNIDSKINYFVKRKEEKKIADLFNFDITFEENKWNKSETIMSTLKYNSNNINHSSNGDFYYNSNNRIPLEIDTAIIIKGYDFILNSFYLGLEMPREFLIENKKISAKINNGQEVIFTQGEKELAKIDLLTLENKLSQKLNNTSIDQEDMMIMINNQDIKLKLIITNIGGNKKDDKVTIQTIDMILLGSLKK